MSTDSTDRLVGSVLDGRFRLDRVLGAGGMGKVYAGKQLSVDRDVAVKVLREELAESDSLVQRFFREAKVVASLRHPNIVGLVDHGRDEATGLLFMAMEYVDGMPLSALVRRGRLPAALAVNIARQVCSGLAEAHAAGVIHRDLKPDNVMLVVTAEGALSVKVLDFGIALPSAEDARLTATGAIIGTPHYMAPEQAQDKGVTAQSDVYALGVLLYEMVTGRLPFVAETPMALLLKVVSKEPEPIESVLGPGELPPTAVVGLLRQMLQKDPTQRPQGVSSVARALDEAAEGDNLRPPIGVTRDSLLNAAIPMGGSQLAVSDTADSGVPVTPLGGATGHPQSTQHQKPALDPPAPGRNWARLVAGGMGLLLFSCCVCTTCVDAMNPVGPPEVAEETEPPHAEAVAAEVDFGVDEDVEVPEPPAMPEGFEAPDPVQRPEAPEPAAPARQRSHKNRPSQHRTQPSQPPQSGDLAARQRAAGTICSTGKCVFEGTEPPGAAVCQGDADCDAECEIGGCPQTCSGTATCRFECDGGGCQQICHEDANCRFECDGGACKQHCLGTSDCVKRCEGGGCAP